MDNNLNKWIIDELNKNDWNISELGRRTKINQSTISKVLSGKRTPGLDFYVKIARAFGEDTIPEMLYVAGLLPVRICTKENDMWTKQLNDEDRKTVIELVDFLKYKQLVEQLTSEERTEFFKFADFLLLKREAVVE